MNRTRRQRYRLTFEFDLRDRSDYEFYRCRLYDAIQTVTLNSTGISPDYLAIEKVEEEKVDG